MELAGAAAVQPSCNSPTPACGLGSCPSAWPCCCYFSALLTRSQSSRAVYSQGMGGAASDRVRHCGGEGHGSTPRWGEGHGIMREGGAAGRTDEQPGNA
jgi:hypothetical protein